MGIGIDIDVQWRAVGRKGKMRDCRLGGAFLVPAALSVSLFLGQVFGPEVKINWGGN